VKTTKSGEYMPFYVTRNELAVSQAAAAAYHLYPEFRFGAEAGLITAGSLDQSWRLEPNSYIARSNEVDALARRLTMFYQRANAKGT
jgi:hypothetical protein